MEQTPAEILAKQLILMEKHDAARKAWRGSIIDIDAGWTDLAEES